MGKKTIPVPKRGDLVVVTWIDIAGSEHSVPELPCFETPGYFHGWEWVRHRDESGKETKNRVLRIDKSRLNGCADYSTGCDRYPKGVVRSIRVVERL